MGPERLSCSTDFQGQLATLRTFADLRLGAFPVLKFGIGCVFPLVDLMTFVV
jgi:hypothetical protein